MAQSGHMLGMHLACKRVSFWKVTFLEGSWICRIDFLGSLRRFWPIQFGPARGSPKAKDFLSDKRKAKRIETATAKDT